MEQLANLHFLRPWWLLLAVPAVLVALFRVWGRPEPGQWKGVIAAHLLAHLVSRPRASRWLSPEVLLLPFALAAALAMAGPAYRLSDTPEAPDDTTLLIVIDLSESMAGRDIGPSRVARLRLKLHDLINLRRGGRVGIIAVAGSAHVVMPPTDDLDALLPYVDVLAPTLMPSDGENFVEAAGVVRALAKGEKGPTVVLVAADAIPPDGAKALAELQHSGLSLIGWEVGTKEGVPGAGVPGLDRAGFSEIERAGASLVSFSLAERDLRRIDAILERARTASVDPTDATLWEDSGYGLVFVVAVGVLFWFRRGWVLSRLGPVLVAFLLAGCSAPPGTNIWLEPWLTPDQQGRRLFEQGKYRQAAEAFQDPMWKGIAYYTHHDWELAQEQFARVQSVEGLYNLANAYAQNREIASAISTYSRALQQRPTFLAARKNRDYFRHLLAGLAQTTEFDELKKPSGEPPDPTSVKLRPDQTEGPEDLAAEAQSKAAKSKDSLTEAENEKWMKRVATDPADFLRAKFSVLDARGGEP